MNREALLGILAALAIVGSLFIEGSEDSQQEAYCENVRLWDYDASHGVAPLDRIGHPNYKEIDCYEQDEK